MKYGDFLKPNSTIGIVAPSIGISIEPYASRFKNACKTFENLGYKIVLCESIYGNKKFRSNTARKRAKEFMQMYLDESIDMIFSVGGGEFMMEILPYIDFEKIKKSKPKYFQGYSDNTNLTFTLTTICDIASIYFENFTDFGMNNWHKSLQDNFEFLNGNIKPLKSYDYYESKSMRKTPENALETYNLTQKTCWKVLTKQKEVEFEGRVIGGCLDLLVTLCGTKFDKVKEFNEKYKNEKIIWYFESCDLTVPSQIRAIWQLKNAGWFKNVSAFVIGRPLNKETQFGINYKEANLQHLKDFGVPVIIDADLGHIPPQIFMINGAFYHFSIDKNGKATVSYELK